MKNMVSSFSWLCDFPIPRRVAVTLVALAALAWSSLAFSAEIHEAVRSGDLAKVQALVKAHPDLVFSKDFEGMTPLHWAAFMGHKDVAEFLLANEADINAKDNKGSTPLHTAVQKGQEEVADLLYRRGGQDTITTTIDYAARDGDLAKVAALIKEHPDLVPSKDVKGRTPLHFAADKGRKEVAELLLANHAEVNAKDFTGDTPLHYASGSGHKDVAELLLAHKAEDNPQDFHGQTPLHLAAANGHAEVAALLKAHGGTE